MSFVNISGIRTADPGNVWAPKQSFRLWDPFAIVMDIQVDSTVIQAGLGFDMVMQVMNPRQDLYNHAWWTYDNGSFDGMPTIDFDARNLHFQWGTNFSIWFSWARYGDALAQGRVNGPDLNDGVFLVQGTVNVLGSDLFARTGQAAFKVRPS